MRTNIPGRTITEQLRNALDILGETNQATADAIGVDCSRVSRFRAGIEGLRLDAVDRLCTHLHVKLYAR